MNTVIVTDLGNGSVSFNKVTNGEVVTLAKATTDWKSDVTNLFLIDTLTSTQYIYSWEELNGIYSPSDIEILFGTPPLIPSVNLSFGTSNYVSTDNKLKSVIILRIKPEINGQDNTRGITLSQVSLGNDCGKVSQFFILINPSFLNGGTPTFADINTTNSYIEKADDNLFIDTDNMGKVLLTTMIRSYDTRLLNDNEYLDLTFNVNDIIVIAAKTTGNSKGDFFASLIWKEFV